MISLRKLLLLLSRFSCVRLCVTHRRQPTRLPCPWDSPGKTTGVGCRFLLQRVKVKSESEVVQSCLPLRDPMDCSLLGSSVHGIFQARGLEWGAITFSQKAEVGTSLVVQWLRLSAPNAGVPGSIPVQGTRSHMPQLKVPMLQLRPRAVKQFFKKRKLR